jgi:5-methylcytosine-specific restriction enzyme A
MPMKVPTFRPRALPGAATSRHRDYNRSSRDPEQAKFYGSARWKRFRAYIKAQRVLCERCRAEGRITPGVEVHHLIDFRQRPDLALDPANVKLWCVSCHSRETASRKRA